MLRFYAKNSGIRNYRRLAYLYTHRIGTSDALHLRVFTLEEGKKDIPLGWARNTFQPVENIGWMANQEKGVHCTQRNTLYNPGVLNTLPPGRGPSLKKVSLQPPSKI